MEVGPSQGEEAVLGAEVSSGLDGRLDIQREGRKERNTSVHPVMISTCGHSVSSHVTPHHPAFPPWWAQFLQTMSHNKPFPP